MRPRLCYAITLTCGLALAAIAHAAGLEFAPADMIGWKNRTFHGATKYELDRSGDRMALHARCRNSASGLFLDRKIDVRATPVIEWSWRVDAVFEPPLAERTKATDDYPARVYVVVDGGLLAWRTRAISYIWASGMPEGADWPNAYTQKAHMVAVRSGAPARPGVWVTERRNVRSDFRRYHGLEVEAIDGVAIMTDCDDRAGTAEAWYGTIRFVAE